MADGAEEGRGAMGPLDIGRVMAALPHRYPMLLVDRVEDLIPDRSITAIKAVTINEQFFQGHFPGRPIMPRRRVARPRRFWQTRVFHGDRRGEVSQAGGTWRVAQA
jgi:3-hydroxymyristoyl/3-hydroxydecanoyl-(acyl carrier protein) dehydratase